MGLFDGAHRRASASFASTAHVARLLGAPVRAGRRRRGAGPLGRRAGARVRHLRPRRADRRRDPQPGRLRPARGDPARGARRGRRAGARRARAGRGVAAPSRHLGLVPAAERAAEALRHRRRALGARGRRRASTWTPCCGSPAPRPTLAGDAVGPGGRGRRRGRRAGRSSRSPAGRRSPSATPRPPSCCTAAGAEVVDRRPAARRGAARRAPAALVIGGGFPEVHAGELSANDGAARRRSPTLAARGAPIAAECAGLLYLSRQLDGAADVRRARRRRGDDRRG